MSHECTAKACTYQLFKKGKDIILTKRVQICGAEYPHTVFTGVSTSSATAMHVQICVYGHSCTIAIFAHALFIGSLTRARRLVAQEAVRDTWLVLYQAG